MRPSRRIRCSAHHSSDTLHRVCRRNPLAHWAVYRIPLRQLLDANWPCGAGLSATANFRDRAIKMLPWAPLLDHDVDNVAEMLLTCRRAAARSTEAVEASARRHAHGGDGDGAGPSVASPPPPPYNVAVNWQRLPAAYVGVGSRP